MEEKKTIMCITAYTVRQVIEEAQKLKIKKEDIVSLFPLNGQVHLVYYKII